MKDDDDDAGAAFDRAAARAARREAAASTGAHRWAAERRYRGAVARFVFALFLLPAHVVAAREVTGWLVVHLVVIAVLASQVASRWLGRHDDPLRHLVPPV